MTTQELRDRYLGLYDYMATSRDPKNMKTFGSVMTQMMDVMLQKMPAEAEEMIDKLESIKWHQYLTPKEADAILAKMDPKAPWTRDVWQKTMADFGLPLEEQPCYNHCALFVTMSMIMSDSSKTLSKYVADNNVMFEFVHALALDKLKDVDKRFDIRHYFNL